MAPSVLGAPVQVFRAPSAGSATLQLVAEYPGLDADAGPKGPEGQRKTPIPVLFYGQHYDALLDEGARPPLRSDL